MRGLLVLLICGAVLIVLRNREPRYHGRSLTSWLQQFADPMTPDRSDEAQNAICSIGIERSLPTLLKLITAKDSAFDKWALNVTRKIGHGRFHWRDAATSQYYGESGFDALGTNAAPAVEALTKLLNKDADTAWVAVGCLQKIGKPAEGAFCQCLTNQDWRVRQLSASFLATITDDPQTYISRVKGCLNDPDISVRDEAIRGIGARHDAPNLIIPILKGCLNDNNQALRVVAILAIGRQYDAPDLAIPVLNEALTNTDDLVLLRSAEAIGRFGTNGAPAFSSLTNLVSSSNPKLASAALEALVAVAPTRAVPTLSNTVVNADVSLAIEALRSLRFIAPDLGVQMTLAQLRSPDPQRRLQALDVAGSEIDSPGIVEALKLARQDENLEVAGHADLVIKQMLPQAAAGAGTK